MNPTEHTIKAQDFRTWLLRQPDERTWKYNSATECVLCSFFKETNVCQRPVVGPLDYRDFHGFYGNIPRWLFDALEHRFAGYITARQLKTALNL